MKMYVKQLSVLVVLVTLYGETIGHGMVMDPPNRASLWRFDPVSPINYDDNANFCGGRAVRFIYIEFETWFKLIHTYITLIINIGLVKINVEI